jgi:hypothetical protein
MSGQYHGDNPNGRSEKVKDHKLHQVNLGHPGQYRYKSPYDRQEKA